MSSVRTEIEASINAVSLLSGEALLVQCEAVARISEKALRSGKKLLFAGNGGSAADSQHMAAEYVSRFNFDRPGLSAIALTTDTSILTAIGNDYGFDKLFSRQIEALGSEGDVFFAYSTSGKSKNILAGLESAREKGLVTIGFTGIDPSEMSSLCDLIISAPTKHTPRIQECHAVIGHAVCAAIESSIFGTLKSRNGKS